MFTFMLIIGCLYGGYRLNDYVTNMSSSTKKAITGSINNKLDEAKAKISGGRSKE